MQPELHHTRRALTRRYGLLIATLLGVFALVVYGQVASLRAAPTRVQLERIASTAYLRARPISIDASAAGWSTRRFLAGKPHTREGRTKESEPLRREYPQLPPPWARRP